MPDPSQFVKAEIEIEGRGSTIPVDFNPTEYSLSKSNEWKYEPVTGNSFTEGRVRRRPAAPDGAQPAVRPELPADKT